MLISLLNVLLYWMIFECSKASKIIEATHWKRADCGLRERVTITNVLWGHVSNFPAADRDFIIADPRWLYLSGNSWFMGLFWRNVRRGVIFLTSQQFSDSRLSGIVLSCVNLYHYVSMIMRSQDRILRFKGRYCPSLGTISPFLLLILLDRTIETRCYGWYNRIV